MKILFEPWKNLRKADKYLQKNDVSWKTVSLTFLAFLAYITLLSAVSMYAAEGAGLLLSQTFITLLALTGFALAIKSFQKDKVTVGLGRYFRYVFVLLFGFVAIVLAAGVVGDVVGGVGSTLFYLLGNISVFIFRAYLPYKVFSLTIAQGIFIAFLGIFPLIWPVGTLYLTYWWIRYRKK